MKKNLVRVLAFLLVLMLALGLLPLGAFAYDVYIYEQPYKSTDTVYAEDYGFSQIDTKTFPDGTSATIKASSYDNLIYVGSELFELRGLYDYNHYYSNPTEKIELKSSITVSGHAILDLMYTAHDHDLSCWYYDDNVHFKHCLECDELFVVQNWHRDGDEDRVCDICGGTIPYHDITVVDSEGGKVAADETSAPYRARVNVSVEPENGYELKKIRFFKVRDDGSKQEIVRHQKGNGYYFDVPTYDVEIVAEFLKK